MISLIMYPSTSRTPKCQLSLNAIGTSIKLPCGSVGAERALRYRPYRAMNANAQPMGATPAAIMIRRIGKDAVFMKRYSLIAFP